MQNGRSVPAGTQSVFAILPHDSEMFLQEHFDDTTRLMDLIKLNLLLRAHFVCGQSKLFPQEQFVSFGSAEGRTINTKKDCGIG